MPRRAKKIEEDMDDLQEMDDLVEIDFPKPPVDTTHIQPMPNKPIFWLYKIQNKDGTVEYGISKKYDCMNFLSEDRKGRAVMHVNEWSSSTYTVLACKMFNLYRMPFNGAIVECTKKPNGVHWITLEELVALVDDPKFHSPDLLVAMSKDYHFGLPPMEKKVVAKQEPVAKKAKAGPVAPEKPQSDEVVIVIDDE